MAKFAKYPLSTRLIFISQSIFQFLLAVFVTSTVWLMAYNSDWNVYHTWHMFLTTVGFSLLMAEAVAFMNEGNGFLVGFSKKTRNILHGIVMVCATGACVAGISIKIQDKTNEGRAHFTSTHGKLGLSALILTLVAFVGGIVVFLASTLYKKLGVKPLWLRVLHGFVGCTAYLIGNITLGYGVHDYFWLATTNTRIGLTVILGIYVILNILLGPVRTAFDNVLN